jgi:hypothetical protein
MRISIAELQRLVRDPATPEAQLRAYFKPNPDTLRPFAPAVIIDPATVDVAIPESAEETKVLGDWANDLARLRRQRIFIARREKGDKSPVLVSEGDSWFQFPFLLDDVIDQLAGAYNVWSVDAAGDTLQNMVLDAPEYMDALREQAKSVRAFLFSSSGNDVVGRDAQGRPVLAKILRRFSPGKPAEWYLETEELARQLRFIESCYREVLTKVAAEFPRLPVLCHGYDYSIPGGFPGDPRRPLWAKQDKWLGSVLKGDLGIHDPGLQRRIISLLIDRLNERIKTLCGGNVPGGAFRTAWHVDARGAVGTVNLWADELHPSNAGFALVAIRFKAVLGTTIAAQEAVLPGAPEAARSLFEVMGTWESPASDAAAAGAGEAPADYVWRGLGKSEFLRQNRVRLRAEIAAVNATLSSIYGSDVVHLTEHDVWVLTYIEAGVANGKVDPDFRHSLGERGILPLPDNIAFWNGRGAPDPKRPMPLGTNLHHFYLYLGHLMNKRVKQTPRFMLYSGLFRSGSFRTDQVKQAQLLAGVVHGYFIGQNYSDRRVPFDQVLAGIERGDSIDIVMRPTRYVHAGSSILTNRARNIAEALALLG